MLRHKYTKAILGSSSGFTSTSYYAATFTRTYAEIPPITPILGS
jgi:hypothetical protein